MAISFDPNLSEIFSGRITDWEFTNDADGGDMNIMRFNNNPYAKFDGLPGYSDLPGYVKDKLTKGTVFSHSEVEGWTRMEFQNQRLIDMFGTDTIYIPPEDMDVLFFKALEKWFDGLAYEPDQQNQPDTLDIMGALENSEYVNSKAYGLTSSLLSIFGS